MASGRLAETSATKTQSTAPATLYHPSISQHPCNCSHPVYQPYPATHLPTNLHLRDDATPVSARTSTSMHRSPLTAQTAHAGLMKGGAGRSRLTISTGHRRERWSSFLMNSVPTSPTSCVCSYVQVPIALAELLRPPHSTSTCGHERRLKVRSARMTLRGRHGWVCT